MRLEPRAALARSVGFSAFIYGYPLLESLRTCRLQARLPDETASTRPGLNELLHWAGPTQAEDRDVVTPANDLMYTTGWFNLAAGPVCLQVPAAARHPGRYFVLALYDAYTENFENLGPRNCSAQGETVWLLGPGFNGHLPEGAHSVQCSTNLVWLIARVLVADEADLPAAKRLQAEMAVHLAPGTPAAPPPPSMAQWSGDTTDPVAALTEQGREAAEVARHFYANLSRALAECPGRAEDAGLIAWFASAGLRAGPGFEWAGLEQAQREGLTQGLAEAAELLASQARMRMPRPWVMSLRNGRYGTQYLARAVVAYIGLGALHPSEALYAASYFDALLQPLDGRNRYSLHIDAADMPPAQAFWSVSA